MPNMIFFINLKTNSKKWKIHLNIFSIESQRISMKDVSVFQSQNKVSLIILIILKKSLLINCQMLKKIDLLSCIKVLDFFIIVWLNHLLTCLIKFKKIISFLAILIVTNIFSIASNSYTSIILI